MDFITTYWALILKIIGGVSGLCACYRFVIKPFAIKPIILSILNEEVSQIRDDAIRYMTDAQRYMTEAREAKQEIEQIKEAVAQDKKDITEKVQAINSQLSSKQAQAQLSLRASADAEIPKDPNARILGVYLKPKK